MGSVVRGLAVYGFLLLLFRVTGKRSLAEITTFDAVLLLIISEAAQQALIDGDNSMTNSFLVIATLLAADVVLSVLSLRYRRMGRLINDVPLVLVEHGRPLQDRMRKVRVEESDVLERARELQGLRSLEEVDYAILERSGTITIIPRAQP